MSPKMSWPDPLQQLVVRDESDKKGQLLYHDLLHARPGGSFLQPDSWFAEGGWGDDYGPATTGETLLAVLLSAFQANHPRWINRDLNGVFSVNGGQAPPETSNTATNLVVRPEKASVVAAYAQEEELFRAVFQGFLFSDVRGRLREIERSPSLGDRLITFLGGIQSQLEALWSALRGQEESTLTPIGAEAWSEAERDEAAKNARIVRAAHRLNAVRTHLWLQRTSELLWRAAVAASSSSDSSKIILGARFTDGMERIIKRHFIWAAEHLLSPKFTHPLQSYSSVFIHHRNC